MNFLNVSSGRDHGRYIVLHDQGKQLCFVGLGSMNTQIAQDFMNSVTISIEELDHKDKSWFDHKQFIVITADVALKKNAVKKIDNYGGSYFSLVHKQSDISDKAHIGVGTFINLYIQTIPNEPAYIGDHCVIGSHCVIAHRVKIHDFCHISPQCYINNCEVFEGSVIGVQAKVVGQVNEKISIAAYSNIMMNSMITKTISTPATYYNNRLVNRGTSLDHRIL
jgi:UDP-3-O-[3-hydroxymyristoyl] glucosamine N-acyltransferase